MIGTAKKQEAKEFRVPRFEDFEEYQEERQKLSDLNVRLEELRQERSEVAQERSRQLGQDRTEARAEAMLSGQKWQEAEGGHDVALRDLNREEKVVQRAIVLQKDRLRHLRSKLTGPIRDQVRPEWERRVQAYTEALEAFWKASAELLELQHQLEGVGTSFPNPRHNDFPGDLRTWGGRTAACVKVLRDHYDFDPGRLTDA